MKAISQIPLRFIYSEGASFDLPILQKALHPTLFPFSSKRLIRKGVKTEKHFTAVTNRGEYAINVDAC